MIQVLFDPIQRDFLTPKSKKLKKLMFLGEIFQIQATTINDWPDLTQLDPSHKKLTQTHH